MGSEEVKKSLYGTVLLIILLTSIERWPRGVVSQEQNACKCVPLNQCENDYGIKVIEFKTSENSCNSSEVCCPIDSSNQSTTIPIPSLSLFKRSCGQKNFDGLFFKIKDGMDTDFGEFPWMIALITIENGVKHLECGGSLIHEQIVLTAAHCIEKFTEKSEMKDLVALGGAWEINATQELYPHQLRSVQKIIIHNDFNNKTGFYDIALLILKDPFEEAENIALVCLPSQESAIVPDNCIVAGWGKDGKDGDYDPLLRYITLSIVPRSQCLDLLRETRLGKRFKLHESFICAGGVKGDVCMGDGGGPLICEVKNMFNQYRQVGVVSWGIDCGVAPGVYVDVEPLVGWIEQQINPIGFQLPHISS